MVLNEYVRLFWIFLILFVLVVGISISLYTSNSPAKKVYPLPSQIPPTIQTANTIRLVKNKTQTLIQLSLQLTLIDVDVPDEKCRDCVTYAKVEVRKENEIKTIEFKTGGIAGIIQDTQGAFGYVFMLKSIEENEITLSYKQQ